MKKVIKRYREKPDLDNLEELIPFPNPVVHDPRDKIISYDDFQLDETFIKLIFKKKRTPKG